MSRPFPGRGREIPQIRPVIPKIRLNPALTPASQVLAIPAMGRECAVHGSELLKPDSLDLGCEFAAPAVKSDLGGGEFESSALVRREP
jgi:hypothetical protein